jgi:hypothetical protein
MTKAPAISHSSAGDTRSDSVARRRWSLLILVGMIAFSPVKGHHSTPAGCAAVTTGGSLLIRIVYPAALMPPRSPDERARVLFPSNRLMHHLSTDSAQCHDVSSVGA